MQTALSTPEAAKLLGVTATRLRKAIFTGKVDAPARRIGLNYLWSHRDLDKAAWALLRRSVDSLLQKESA